MAAHRAAHELRDAYREESGGPPGRDGYPDGEAAPVLASPGSHRRQAEGALLSLADKAIEVMKAALAANATPPSLRAPLAYRPSGGPWLGGVGEGVGVGVLPLSPRPRAG